MATYTPSTRLMISALTAGASCAGGGDDGRGGDSVPDYGARLRRARLGLICGIATVCMVFVSLTSAYVVRQGLPTFDGASKATYAIGAAWTCLGAAGDQYRIAAGEQRDDGVRAAQDCAAGSAGAGEVDSRSFAGRGERLSLAGCHRDSGLWFSGRAMDGVGRACSSADSIVNTNPSSSFVFLLTATHAVHLAGGMIALLWAASASLLHKPVEVAADRGRHHGLVLAFHGCAVDLRFCVVGIGAIARQKL